MSRRDWLIVAGIAALGLALRLLAAQGALWLDEAWSATTAHDVGTPLGVFLEINHDNNHHLNTLWLQLVGLDAPPMLQRGLSILTGTLAIPVAAMIAARQGKAAALAAALLFAVSPLLVTYGAEARGYAPMVLMLLVTVLLVANWLDDPSQRAPAIPIGLAVLLGMFSQLTMAFGLAALALWVGWTLYRNRPPREASVAAARILLPVIVPAIAVLAIIFGAARAAGTGMRLGNYEPFSLTVFADGWGAMLLTAFGGPLALVAAILLSAPPDTPSPQDGPARDRVFFLLALLIPFGIALLQVANSGAPRYHLLSGLGAMMLVAMHSGPRLAPGRASRLPVGAALALVTIAALITDNRIIANRRADPAPVIDSLIAAQESEIAVERDRSTAILRMAAASRHLPLTVIEGPCPATRFWFVDRDGDAPFPDPAVRCDNPYHVVAEGHPTGLSGTHWKLYERGPLAPQ
ncbi:glycosyltransferase family 39 protein [Sphingomonas sp. LB-2]|uniref:glycosyltransferase family 39 protein n=1 Tax=Sphingomonas caeni TaxID=2984949 RepID=UPI0022327D0C|nr:glycosyltransferase family 39 protein [Sphingomonas caeni]MCW3847853.1 glycosyltransferase family 39 protein [Sphingomonas caeni]